MRNRLISLAVVLLAGLALAPGAWAATTFTVGGIGDGGDTNLADGICSSAGGVCTLRAAIEQSNATSSGAPHTINLQPVSGQTLTPATSLPAITRDRTFLDGCGVGREIVQDLNLTGLPKPPASNPCVGLRGSGVLATGLRATGTDGVYVQGLAISGFLRGIHLWGADGSHLGGNWFGLRRDGTTTEANVIGISVTGRAGAADPATENFVGGGSHANDEFDPACDAYCNLIVSSSGAGVDLGGSDSSDAPAGGACGAFTCGNFVQGNWIGVASADGTVVRPNATAVTLGNSDDTEIGGFVTDEANVIAGNTKGVDQSSGTGKPWLLGGTYGISPDGNLPVPNGSWNASLGGSSAPGGGAFVSNVTFGPAAIGLELLGPQARVVSSSFLSPPPPAVASFGTAAVRIGPDADNAFIGSNLASLPVCFPGVDLCNLIKDTAAGAAGIWVDGANDTRIWRNAIGGGIAEPIPGPPIRITGAAVGADIGDSDDDPDTRNFLGRLAGAAIEVGGTATRIVIGDNEGKSLSTIGPPSGIFTDLLPASGPGNSGPVNNGIQPPSVTTSSIVGVGGTGIPGARIHVLVQDRGTDDGPPFTYIETAKPPTPSTTTVGDDGIWGYAFPTPLASGVKLLASQTTADGTSEYTTGVEAAASNPPPVVSFRSGPFGVVQTRSATFTFEANRPASRLQCSVDAGAFVPCTSPLTLNGLEIGGHQLQVKATDPTGKVGAPASRTWIVQFDEPFTPPAPTPPASASRTLRFSSVVSLPSAKRCISKRSLRIAVRAPKGRTVKSATIRIGGRRVGSSRGAKTIPVSLKGLPRGRFVVRVTVTFTDGRIVKGSRTYRTCAKKKVNRRR